MPLSHTRRKFSVSDYHRMHEVGIFSEDDRVELIEGEIFQKSPAGPLHNALTIRLNKLLVQLAGDQPLVGVKSCIRLNDLSVPQPDFAVFRPNVDSYEDELPQPPDVFLLIEISDSSLTFDRVEKLPRYASAGIEEVWIVDANQQIIERYSSPRGDQYTQIYRCLKGQLIQSVMLPCIQFHTDRIFR